MENRERKAAVARDMQQIVRRIFWKSNAYYFTLNHRVCRYTHVVFSFSFFVFSVFIFCPEEEMYSNNVVDISPTKPGASHWVTLTWTISVLFVKICGQTRIQYRQTRGTMYKKVQKLTQETFLLCQL